MKIEIRKTIQEGIKDYFTITFSAIGEYIENISGTEQLSSHDLTCYSKDGKDLMNTIEKREKVVMKKLREELMLNNFKKNIITHGYSRKLAIKEVLEEKYQLFFQYDLLGFASFEELNNKGAVIEDMFNKKHLVGFEYIDNLSLDQFYVLEKE